MTQQTGSVNQSPMLPDLPAMREAPQTHSAPPALRKLTVVRLSGDRISAPPTPQQKPRYLGTYTLPVKQLSPAERAAQAREAQQAKNLAEFEKKLAGTKSSAIQITMSPRSAATHSDMLTGLAHAWPTLDLPEDTIPAQLNALLAAVKRLPTHQARPLAALASKIDAIPAQHQLFKLGFFFDVLKTAQTLPSPAERALLHEALRRQSLKLPDLAIAQAQDQLKRLVFKP